MTARARGIRIPKAILEECRLEDAVELHATKGRLVVKPAGASRHGWDGAFRRMAEAGDDALLDGPVATRWDRTRWRW